MSENDRSSNLDQLRAQTGKQEPEAFRIPANTRPKSDLIEGERYPALMRVDDATVEQMKFGPTVKIPYDIWFRDTNNEWSSVTMSELASLNWSQSGRLVKRLQLLNKPFDEETDLSTVFQRGWVDVILHRKDNGYLAIEKVLPASGSVERPTNVPSF